MKIKLSVFASLLALAALFVVPSRDYSPTLQAQGYSGALPNITAAAGTSLRLPYSAGTVANGGALQVITADGTGLLATASQASCAAPAFTGCNFVYWTSSTALSITTSATTAFTPGNVVIAYVTTTADDILQITPSSWSPATSAITGSPSSSSSGSYFVSPAGCGSSVSGNATGTNGLTTVGTAPSIGVVQAQTDNSSTNTHYYRCNITPPPGIAAPVNIVSAVFMYGVQTTGLGTQVATLASGTMNSQLVFSKITYPVSGSAETPLGLADAVRADAGTLVINPVVGSFNVSTTTASKFYSATFTPATPIAANTALTQYYLTVALLNTATAATVTNSPGVLVNYTY